MTKTELTWTAPGPGRWEWGGSHIPGVLTPIYAPLHKRTAERSMALMFERYGVPLATLREEFVNGRAYTQLSPLIGKAGGKLPPKPVLWLASRLHPTFRARNKTAAAAWEGRIWRARTEEWRTTLRPAMRAHNVALQSEDLDAMDDEALLDHLDRALAHAEAGAMLHFDLHGDDMGPLGLFLSACQQLGIEPRDGLAALAGYSPSTAAPLDALHKVAVGMLESGWTPADPAPASLDALRALGPSAASALDDYLHEYGWRTVTGYDIDARTVGELPEALVANVLANIDPFDWHAARAGGDAAADALLARVPADRRAELDDALAEARVALDMRDDNGPITIEWPAGLVRRALLAIGDRLVARGLLVDRQHAVELDVPEVRALVRGDSPLTADAVARRAADRAEASAVTPPAALGEPEELPDLSAFPAPLARMTAMAMVAVSLLERAPVEDAVHGALVQGLGVGAASYTGRARVAQQPEEALATIEPGDVLVVPFTTPAYNAVLAVCGAVITEEGGALAHAAVLARELGIPAVVGAEGALTAIDDGTIVTVDPVAGTVTHAH